MKIWPMAMTALAGLMMVGSVRLAAAEATPAGGEVLAAASVWRMHHTLRPPLLQPDGGAAEPYLRKVEWLDWHTPPPPADWTKPEFNDRTWLRGPLRRSARTPYLARLGLRGKFEVTDPAAAGDLALSLKYHGGVIVCLNGKEVGRGNLPAGGEVDQLLAESYPKEAFLDDKGELLVDSFKTQPPPVRARSLELTVPKNLLRQGVNVLAVEVVRAPYPAMLKEKKPRGVGGPSGDPGLLWNTCEILSASLSAAGAAGIVPNCTRPAGVRVWNADPMAGDVNVDYGDRTEPLLPVVIVSPRNGGLYGKVLIGNDKPIKNLKVAAGDLKGPGTIPAAQVSFLYGVPGAGEHLVANGETERRDFTPYPDGVGFLNAMLPEPRAEFPVAARNKDGKRVNGAVVPLWIRVKVPKNAPPGDYRGELTIAMEGEGPVKVPVVVKVMPWTVPDPQDFRTWVELIQSPDTLAVEYETPLWSDRHWELIAQSFRCLGNVGARSLYLPAVAHTNLGNEESMIRWIKQGDGKYDWDFSVMDKYLDTAQRHLGTPKLLVLVVWEVYMNTKNQSTGRRFGEILDENQKFTGGCPMVTFVDPATGKAENGLIPKLGDPASKEIWKGLVTKVRERLKARGLEQTLVYGMFTDSAPNKDDAKMFLDIAPDLGWVQQGHNAFKDLHGIAKMGYTANWWSQNFADGLTNQRSDTRDNQKKSELSSMFGWNRPRLDAYFPRMTNEPFPPSYWHFMCETAITGDFYRGIGRVGADYWMAIKNKNGKRSAWVNDRFQEVKGYLHELRSYVLEPQPEGPAATIRLLALEQGVHECEARIFIEDALVNQKITGELADRCQQALDQRMKFMWTALNAYRFGGWGVTAWRFQPGVAGHAWFLGTNHQGRNEKLYALAAEVEKKTGGK